MFGHWEIILLIVVVVIVFGARKLPEIGSGIGKGIKNLKKSLKGEDEIDITPEKGEKEEKSQDRA